jgi:hypothetical protein
MMQQIINSPTVLAAHALIEFTAVATFAEVFERKRSSLSAAVWNIIDIPPFCPFAEFVSNNNCPAVAKSPTR